MVRPTICTLVGVAVLATSGAARAEDIEKGSFGIGLIIGEPTGVSARLYLKDDQAVQAAVGSAFVGGGLQVHADYCFHPWILSERDTYTMPVYFGPGARLIRYDDGRDDHFYALGLRAVAGAVFDFKNVPLDVFLEIAGVAEYGFADDEGFGLSLNGGAGIRYYF
jgi:hypothetical protein